MRPTIFGNLQRIALGVVAAAIFLHLVVTSILLLSARGVHNDAARGDIAVAFYGDAGEATRARVDAAAHLLLQGRVDDLAMVGGYRPGTGYHGAMWMAELATEIGVPDGRVAVGAGSFDSLSNMEAFAGIVGQAGATQRVVLVSDCLHLLRLAWIARRTLPDLEVQTYCALPSRDPLRTLVRSQHELIAWASLVLPRRWREAWLARMRDQ
ncbi:YdcF family protein [Maricaulis sp.]|uniref:YdcF family protein n=1 Tax=Maricaulis sp. TaxID=1486257 RepID=UPI002B2722A1|nr:YdcF family protein [Maricaulis sp.]